MSSEKRAAMVSSALQILETTSSSLSTEYKQMIAINFGISRGCLDELFSWLAPQSVASSKNISQVSPASRHGFLLSAVIQRVYACSDDCGGGIYSSYTMAY